MRIMVQQPHYFPELYLWNRMLNVDAIVMMDNVQANLRSTQKKTPIKLHGEKHWLTIPIDRSNGSRQLINEVKVSFFDDWRFKHKDTLYHAYHRSKFYDLIISRAGSAIFARTDNLININVASILRFGCFWDKMHEKIYYLSDLDIDGSRYKKSDLILEVCKRMNATEYLCGKVSVVGDEKEEPYLDLDSFREAGIKVVAQNWTCPKYPQIGKGEFIPNLSILDLVFNVGYDKAYEVLKDEQVEYL